MKRVTLQVAKALKEVGYPQENCGEYYNKYGAIDTYSGHNIARPYTLEVWDWLWRIKGICIEIKNDCYGILAEVKNQRFYGDTPEEAIVAAIDYLVKHNLIEVSYWETKSVKW